MSSEMRVGATTWKLTNAEGTFTHTHTEKEKGESPGGDPRVN